MSSPAIWHDTPGQYIECTCKLTTTKNIKARQQHIINRLIKLTATVIRQQLLSMIWNYYNTDKSPSQISITISLWITGQAIYHLDHLVIKTKRWSFRRSQPRPTLGLQHSLRPHLVIISKHCRDFSRRSHSPSHHIMCFTLINLISSGLSSISTKTQ